MKTNDSFVFYKDWWTSLSGLTKEMRLQAIEAIMDYAFNGKEPEDTMLRFATAQIRAFIDRDKKKYEDAIQQRKDAIRKRWEKVRAQREQNTNEYGSIRPNTTEYDRIRANTDNVNVNENDNVAIVDKSTDSNNKKESVEKKSAAFAATLKERKSKFYEQLTYYVAKYGVDTVRAFFEFWTETTQDGTRMRFETERTWETGYRLSRWVKRGGQFGDKGAKPRKATIGDIYEHVHSDD